MIYIALIAVITLLLLEFSGSIPDSSVGGPMTIATVIFATALAVGIRDAWLNKRGVLGWIVSIIASFVGMFVAAQIAGTNRDHTTGKAAYRATRSHTHSPWSAPPVTARVPSGDTATQATAPEWARRVERPSPPGPLCPGRGGGRSARFSPPSPRGEGAGG